MTVKKETLKERRAALEEAPHRPAYHFFPPGNWMNDPNGPLQWGGKYHLFYQHNPNGPFHGTIHWGHAWSGDLLHWKDLSPALYPEEGGPDEDGCYSGCSVIGEEGPALIYTGVEPQVQCLAFGESGEKLEDWRKYSHNPVIDSPPAGLEPTGFRDPFVWEEEGAWFMVLGSGEEGKGGLALLYRSEDLREWEYLHPLYTEKGEGLPDMWECPLFFELEDRHVLVVSPFGLVRYWVGEYGEGKMLQPLERGVFDWGETYYAPNTFLDDRGRRIVWGWLREGRSEEAQREAGWSGALSLPRVLSLEGNELNVEPAEEVKRLRKRKLLDGEFDLSPGAKNPLEGFAGEELEILLEMEPSDPDSIELSLRRSPDGEEETVLVYRPEEEKIVLDRSRSSLGREVTGKEREEGIFPLVEGKLRLRIFLDHSIVEVFPEKGSPLTARTYPCREESKGLSFSVEGGSVSVERLAIWEMSDVW